MKDKSLIWSDRNASDVISAPITEPIRILFDKDGKNVLIEYVCKVGCNKPICYYSRGS